MNLGFENEKVEFKKSTAEINDAMKSISAMLNKNNEGTLFFGVDNNGTVVGQQIGTSTIRDITRRIYETIKPTPNIHVEICNNEKVNYIKVTFFGNEYPYSASGKYFLRVSDEDREVTPKQLKDLFIESNPTNEKWENQLTTYSLDEVDINILNKYYLEGINVKRFVDHALGPLKILSELNLLKNDKLTNAGYFLLSKNKPLLLKLAIFASPERITFIDQVHFRGNILECIEEGIKYISANIRWAAEIGPIRRDDIPEIPVEAIREIVINGFAHAKYENILSSHEIDIFPTKITIFNPGNLLHTLDPKLVALGREPSVIRNPNISNALFRFNLVEAFGTGFQKVFKYTKNKNIQINYFNNSQGFTFEFIRPKIDPIKVKNVPIKLNNTENSVYQLLVANNTLTIDDMTIMLGVSRKTISRAINILKDNKLIERVGSNKKGSWKILK